MLIFMLGSKVKYLFTPVFRTWVSVNQIFSNEMQIPAVKESI